MTPITALRRIGRSRFSPTTPTGTDDVSLHAEEQKALTHQSALAFTVAPLGLLLVGAGLNQLETLELKICATAMIGFGALSAFLRICLIAVARWRIRKLLEARQANKDSLKIYFTSLGVQSTSEILAALTYVSAAIFLLLKVWA